MTNDFIEFIIKITIQTAMILAAGRGERLRPLTDHTPKPLIQVAGKPLIVWHIERLVKAGFIHIVINHAHLGQQIVDCLGDGSQWNIKISYSAEAQALETGGGIKKALPLLDEDVFLVVNADVFCDFDFINLRLTEGQLAHLILVPNPEHNLKGDFSLDQENGLISDRPQYTYSGIGLYSSKLFSGITDQAFPLAPLLRDAMKDQKVSGHLHKGYWSDVGTVERLEQTERDIS